MAAAEREVHVLARDGNGSASLAREEAKPLDVGGDERDHVDDDVEVQREQRVDVVRELVEARVHVPDRPRQVELVLAAVENGHLVAAPVELADDVRPDEAGSAEDEDVHERTISGCYHPDSMSRRRPIGFAPADEPLAPLFVRIPAGLAERLDRAAVELRRPKQELVAAALGEEEWALGRAEVIAPVAPPREVLTTEQLAELLQLDVETVRRLAARGELPGRKVAGQWRFSRRAILDWLAEAGSGTG